MFGVRGIREPCMAEADASCLCEVSLQMASQVMEDGQAFERGTED